MSHPNELPEVAEKLEYWNTCIKPGTPVLVEVGGRSIKTKTKSEGIRDRYDVLVYVENIVGWFLVDFVKPILEFETIEEMRLRSRCGIRRGNN